MRVRPLYDFVAVLVRIGVGVVFVAHGWRKIQVGITATAQEFDRLGVPAPTPAAIYATFVELLGGLGLIIGLGLPVAGLLLFLDMAGAFVFVHAGNGLFVADGTNPRNGFELVLVLGLVSLLFAAGAGGRLTIDRRLWGRGGGHDGDGGDDDQTGDGGFWAGTGADDDAAGTTKPGRASEPRGASGSATATGSSPGATAPAADSSSPRSRPQPRPKSAAEIIEDPPAASPDRLVAGRKSRTRKNTGTGTGTGTGGGTAAGPGDPVS